MTDRFAVIDIETFSTVDIKAGLDNYKKGAELLLVSWKYPGEPVQLWDATKDPMPDGLRWLLENDDCKLVAHNSGFEQDMLAVLLPEIQIDPARWRCTMIRAFAHGLPGGLDYLCQVFKLAPEKAKAKTGKQLINLFCKPLPKTYTLRRATRLTHAPEWQWFCEYCTQDVVATEEIWTRLPNWNYENNPTEFALWRLDHTINRRGMLIDTQLCEAAVRAVDAAQASLRRQTQEITNGAVQSTTQRDKLLAHILGEYGVDLPDLQSATLERRMNDPELPEAVRQLLAIRLQASTSSTSKYKKLLLCTSADGRLRHALQFDGAARTRRWSGRGPQMHNMPRMDVGAVAEWAVVPAKRSKYEGLPSYPGLSDKTIEQYLETGVAALKGGSADLGFDDVMALASNCTRGTIIAPPGKKLVVADLSNIEGRACAWLAGEEWKLEAFRAYDRGEGPDLYRLAFAKAFGMRHEDVSKPQRQVGKVLELFMQYGGGVGAFITGAATYGIDLGELADAAFDTIPADVMAQAARAWDWAVPHLDPRTGRTTMDRTYGLERRVYVVCDSLKRLWRRQHPAICGLAERVGALTLAAIQNPGQIYRYRDLAFQRSGAWLRIRLPSGAYLCYVLPKVRVSEDEDGKVIGWSYWGVNPYTKMWGKIHTYGSKVVENATQGVSRDALSYNMPAAEAAGYTLVHHVHDEDVAEVPDTAEFTGEGLSAIMATNAPWAVGLPLAAKGFETYRYRKAD